MSFTRGLLQILKTVPSSVTHRTISSTACVYGIKSRWTGPLYRELKHRQKKLEEKDKVPKNIRSQYIEWNYNSEIYAFGQRLQEEFEDSLLRQALTDASYIEHERRQQESLGVESPGLQMNSNAELSSTGKALIADYVLKFLRASLPLLPEEGIRTLGEYLSSVEVLSDVGHGIGLKDIILTAEHPPTPDIVGRAFEAVVAVLNVSSGLDRCHRFIKDFVLTQLVGKDIYDIWQIDEPLNVLSDILLRSNRGVPEPRLVFQAGQRTLEAVFQVALYSDKQFIGTGYGETGTIATEQAAWDALRRLFEITDSSKPLPLEKMSETIKISTRQNLSLENWSTDKAKNIVAC